MTRIFSRFGLVIVVLLIVAGAWLAYIPILNAGRIHAAIEKRTGRTLNVAGGAGYVLSPEFGIGLHDVSLGGSGALAEPVVKANTLILPAGIWQVLTGQSSGDRIILDGADINVVLSADGRSNVWADEDASTAKTDAQAAEAKSFSVTLYDGHFRYHDERSKSGFEVKQISGDTKFGGDGSVASAGSGVVRDQFVNFQLNLASLRRGLAEGSPFDFNMDGVASTFAFTGRLATGSKLNLAGQADVGTTDLPRFLRWIGMPLKGLDQAKMFSLSGGVDVSETGFQMKDTRIKLASMTGKGDVDFETSAPRPLLKANLGFDKVDLNLYQNVKGESTTALSSWGEKPIELFDLDAVDAQVSLSTNAVIYNTLKTGPATLTASLRNRVLQASLKSGALAQGAGEIDVEFDAAQLPPKLRLDLDFKNVEAKTVLASLFGITWMTGPLTFVAKLSASGDTQAAFISNLAGSLDAKLENGAVTGVDLSKLIGLASADGADGWLGTATTSVTASTTATITDGVAILGESRVASAGVNVVPAGEIDLLRQSLDLSADAGLPVKLSIKGPWQKPKIYADLGSVLENPKAIKKLLGKLIGN